MDHQAQTSLLSQKSLLTARLAGIPVYLWIILVVITAAGLVSGSMGTDFGSTFFWLTIMGAVVMYIGDRLPIVKDYLGGGPLLLLLLGSYMTYANIIPETYVTAANDWMSTFGVQAFFLTLLIVGSVMKIDRQTLIRSLIGYLPCIFGGLIGATALGALMGKLLGFSLGETLMSYVMPIMGGGSAAGALPMSAIYEEVTGGNKDAYYGVAMSAVMIANIMCIFFATGLNTLGKFFPRLTGDGSQLMRRKDNSSAQNSPADDTPATMQDISNAMWIMVGCWVVAGLFSQWLLPSIAGIPIHQYAYLVVFAVLLNVLGLLPSQLRKGVAVVYRWLMMGMAPAAFCGMAVSLLDFQSFLSALSLPTLCMSVAIIIGCIIGSSAIGYLVGYYPIDAAVTGGLCMANMGGSGDMLILSAGHRMGLMSYASVSSRIGGAIVLAISGVVFGMFG